MYKFEMPEPAMLEIAVKGGESVEVDLLQTHADMVTLETKHAGSENGQLMDAVREYLADLTGMTVQTVAVNQARAFWDYVISATNAEHEERKKKLSQIVFSHSPIPASPETSETGATTKKDTG